MVNNLTKSDFDSPPGNGMGRSDALYAFVRLGTFNAPQRHISAITAYI